MGRPRKSVEEKILRGTFRADREPPLDLSAPLQKLPRLPDRLSKAGKAAWRRVGAHAIQIQSLRRSDLEMLELASAALGMAADAEELIRIEGMVLTSPTGATKPNPAVAILLSARSQANKALAIFRPVSNLSRPTLCKTTAADAGSFRECC